MKVLAGLVPADGADGGSAPASLLCVDPANQTWHLLACRRIILVPAPTVTRPPFCAVLSSSAFYKDRCCWF